MEQEEQKIKYFAYCRKSTDREEKQALSIDSQKDKVKEIFDDLDIVETLEEKHSAFKPYNRPIFGKMIERIKNGEAQGIIAWHPDRLSRNEIDGATITYMIRTGEIKNLKFGSYNFDNSPEGIMMLQMALSNSQYSSAKLSKDVKRGLEKKAKIGWRSGASPAGYLNTPEKEKGSKTIRNDPQRFGLVRKMWDLMLTGNYTPPQILEIVNNEWGYKTLQRKKIGGKPLSRSGIYKIFTNTFYYGCFEFPQGGGVWYKGQHESMITEEEFNRVQILLGRKGKPKPHDRVFAFTGLMRCGECGCSITAEAKNQIICPQCKLKFPYENKIKCPKCETAIEEMKNPTILNYVYYHCTKRKNKNCTQGGIKIEELEKQIDDYLASVQINQKYLDWAIKYLCETHKSEADIRNEIIKSQQQGYDGAVNRLDKLLEMRMANEITEEEYKEKKFSIIREKEKFQELLKDSDNRQNQWLELSEKTFNFARYARFWFAEGDLQRKREILATLGQNLILEGKKLHIQAQEPFSILQKGLQQILQKQETLEPIIMPKNGSKNEKFTQNLDEFPIWLARWDDFRKIDWIEDLKYPEFILAQTKQLLQGIK